MEEHGPNTDLMSDEGMKVLDTIDDIRLMGNDKGIYLPQIVVVGSQSVGKSSVLEAISGIPFPVADGMCTTFVTEIHLRRSKIEKETIAINVVSKVPGQPGEEKLEPLNISGNTMHANTKSLTWNQIPSIIHQAAGRIHIGQGQMSCDKKLRIEVTGPTQDHLSLIDLPGIYNVLRPGEDPARPQRIMDTVRQYMEEKQSVILAVISAKIDLQNNEVLKIVKQIDPSGIRTIGIITWVDMIQEGSNRESDYISLAQNKLVPLALGWHVIRNFGHEDRITANTSHDTLESAFFSERAAWLAIPQRNRGASQLRKKLSATLLTYVSKELGVVISSIEREISDYGEMLGQFGQQPSTLSERLVYLTRLGTRYQLQRKEPQSARGESQSFPYETETNLVDSFASMLIGKLPTPIEPSDTELGTVLDDMAILLRNFAADLGAEKFHEDVLLQQRTATFVLINRNKIVAAFSEIFSIQARLRRAKTGRDTSTVREVNIPAVDDTPDFAGISGCTGNPNAQEAPHGDNYTPQDATEINTIVPNLNEVRKLMETSPSLHQLVEKLKARMKMTSLSGTLIEKVRGITSKVAQTNFGAQLSSRTTFTCSLNWDPVQFLLEQFEIPTQASLCNIITITRSWYGSQAATCLDYVRQIWPVTGEELLCAIQEYVHNMLLTPWRHIPPLCVELSNSTEVEISLSNSSLSVKSNGLVHSIADMVEQLAWLGAACRENPVREKLGLCLIDVQPLNEATPGTSIAYSFRELQALRPPANDTSCWHALFRNAVIVDGYPTPRRMHNEKGLEICLQLMLELGLVDNVTTYNGGILIDGLQSIFVPILRSRESIQWHFLHSAEDECIMYSQADELCPGRLRTGVLTEADIGVARQFVGWTSKAEIRFGSDTAPYQVRASRLDRCGRGCVLEKASISGGKFVSVGLTIGRGKKDESLWVGVRDWYRVMISWASRTNIILYDARDRQAWLTDGAGALLHLSRAQLSLGIFDGVNLQNYRPPNRVEIGNACQKALLDNENRMIEVDRDYLGSSEERTFVNGVWETKTVTKYRIICFQDMVKDNWRILNQIFSHSKPPAGIELGNPLRKHIEGFDFADIVHSAEEMVPRTQPVSAHGRSWLEFAHAIHAITLFGTGFGDLIVPAEGSNKLCELWRRPPKGRDYLIASVVHLDRLREQHSNSPEKDSDPFKLCKGIHWYRGHRLFEHCSNCTTAHPCDRAQSLHSPMYGPRVNPGPLKDRLEGAVIFGKTVRNSLWHRDDDLQTGVSPLPDSQLEPNEEAVSDGGLGPGNGDGSCLPGTSSTAYDLAIEEASEPVSLQHNEAREPPLAPESSDSQRLTSGEQLRDTARTVREGSQKRTFRRYLSIRLR